MKKAPIYLLALSVVVIISILAYFIYMNLAETNEISRTGLICSVIFLALAFIAIELLFKPYLFLRPREEETEEE